MAKPLNLESYDPKWESLAITLLSTTALITIPETFTRQEVLDIRQTFYGYRKALGRATKDASIGDMRREEHSTLYRATMAFQCHVDPNPNDRRNDAEIFTMKFLKQGATKPIKKFFDALQPALPAQPEFTPTDERQPSAAQEGIDAYLSSVAPDEEK